MSLAVCYRYRLVVPLAFLIVTGCTDARNSRWEDAQKLKTQKAVSTEAVEGGEFNKFFPKVEDPYDLVYKQEKKGTAIASLKKGGKEVATLTVFDTVSNPDARTEFKESTQAFQGYPLVAKGAKGTALLIGNRFQVQVRSMDDAFEENDRKEWLKKFDLDGIGKLN